MFLNDKSTIFFSFLKSCEIVVREKEGIFDCQSGKTQGKVREI